MSKLVDLHTKQNLDEPRKLTFVYDDELKNLIQQKDEAQFEERAFYQLVCDFVHKNNLQQDFLSHIKQEQLKLKNGGHAEPLDYDHIAMDFE